MNTGITAINEEVQRAGAFVQPLFAEMDMCFWKASPAWQKPWP
jgi:hypothetical protein